MRIRAGVLTLSDRSSRGEYEDRSGPAIREGLRSLDIEWVRVEILPDEEETISSKLRDWCDLDGLDLIVTTGGTGPAPRGVRRVVARAAVSVGSMVSTSLARPEASVKRWRDTRVVASAARAPV